MGSKKETDFSSLRQILDHSAAMKRIREHNRQRDLRQMWYQVLGEVLGGSAGESASRQTRPIRYRGGTLFVEVFSAPFLLELATFRKQELIEKLSHLEDTKGIVNLVFRHG